MFAIPCTLTAPAEIHATHGPQSRVAEYRIEVAEPDHTHAEQDGAMLEFAHLDVHAPSITGELIQSQQSQELLLAANRGMQKWWAGSVLGQGFVLGELLRDLRAKGRTLDEGGMFSCGNFTGR